MSAPVGRREFFALEAGEYLERLALLAGGPTVPDAEDLVRYARALRGAALDVRALQDYHARTATS